MLALAEEHLIQQNPDAKLSLYGQEYNPQSYAICKSDLLAKGYDATNIAFGNTLTNDAFKGRQFDFCMSNPPYGVDWKQYAKAVTKERDEAGPYGRFAAGLPSTSDGQMLFLLHLVHKMRAPEDGGGRAGIVMNGSPLFNGAAESGPSNIRKWLLENDLVDAIVALPTNMFFNTGIATDYLDRETARIDTLIEEQKRLIEILGERRLAVVDAALMPLSSWTRTTLKHMLSGVAQGVSPQAEAGLADEPGTWGVLKTGCVNRGVFRPEEHKRLPSNFTFEAAIAVEVGDVIVSRASGSPDLVGSAAIVEHLDYRLILSDKLFRLEPKRSVDPRFLAWCLNSGQYRVQVRRAISGAEGLANNLPLSKLRAFEMYHPSLEEQRRIAAYLDEQTVKIDTLIAETERFIELSKERRSALITAAVTGQIDVREMV